MTFFEAIMIFSSGAIFGFVISALMQITKRGDEDEKR